MRIYLVNPPADNGIQMVREGRCMQRKGAWAAVWPPVTLSTMAGMLKRKGFTVKLSDCIVENITYQGLKDKIAEVRPDLVVINTATASIYSDLKCVKIVKSVSQQIKTIVFGLHVTVLPDEAFSLASELDYVIRGEAEFCLLELVSALKNRCDITEIKGLSYRDKHNIRHNADRGFDDNLNDLTMPAWEFINVNNYRLPLSGEPFLLVTTSKGCPHACLFCPAKPFYGRKLRFRNFSAVVDEMEYVKKKYGVKQFLIWSESFTENREYVFSLCNEIIRRKLDVSWVCNSRVDRVDIELLKIIKRAGCWMVGYGIESGVQEILDNTKKGITVGQIERAVDLAKKAGLEITAHVIFGLPGETIATGRRTIKWLKRLGLDFIQVYCVVPWPSSPLYDIAKKNNWLRTDDWRLFEQNHSIMDIETISSKEVESLRRRAFWEFYLSPGNIVRVLKKIRLSNLKESIGMIREFISWI